MMNAEIGFGRKVLQIFEDNEIPFEHMPSSIDTMTVLVDQSVFEEKEQAVFPEFSGQYNRIIFSWNQTSPCLPLLDEGWRVREEQPAHFLCFSTCKCQCQNDRSWLQ